MVWKEIVVSRVTGDTCIYTWQVAFCLLGLDLHDMMAFGGEIAQHEDIARKCGVVLKSIRLYQNSITALEQVDKACFYILKYVKNLCKLPPPGGGLVIRESNGKPWRRRRMKTARAVFNVAYTKIVATFSQILSLMK